MVFSSHDGPSVLVAHASQPVAARIGFILAHHGMNPLHAPHGHAAVSLLETKRPRGAVIDVALPGVMSFQIVDRVRASPHLAQTAVVLVASVFNRTAYKRRPSSLYGADDYVEQHHVHDLLPRKLRKLLGMPELAPAEIQPDGVVSGQDTRLDLYGRERMRSLALSIVADIALYRQEEMARAATGDVPAQLLDVLDEGRRLLVEMMSPQTIEGDPIADALRTLVSGFPGAPR